MDPSYANYAAFKMEFPEPVKVIKVYDGDTVTIGCTVNDRLTKFNVRMLGYDCAEMRSHDQVEKDCAHEAQKDLKGMILGKKVTVVKNEGFDKYGRLLLELNFENQNVNTYMRTTWGVEYDGGHKNNVDWSAFPKGTKNEGADTQE